jgi:hypothetical protein
MNITINVFSDKNKATGQKEARVVCTPYEHLEVEITTNGTTDGYSEIPKRDGFAEEPHENVQLIFCVRQHPRERFNEEHGKDENSFDGIGELWIHRLPDANNLTFTTYIAFEAATYLKSMQNFEADFEIHETPLRQSDKGEAYLIEHAVFQGLTTT